MFILLPGAHFTSRGQRYFISGEYLRLPPHHLRPAGRTPRDAPDPWSATPTAGAAIAPSARPRPHWTHQARVARRGRPDLRKQARTKASSPSGRKDDVDDPDSRPSQKGCATVVDVCVWIQMCNIEGSI